MNATLLDRAVSVLAAATPREKIAAARAASSARAANAPLGDPAAIKPPIRPARPAAPALVPHNEVPRRRFGSPEGRAALLHAIGHIEFNAIDLAFDMAARFSGEVGRLGLDANAFAADWLTVGGDEARHFELINGRLGDLGYAYGDFPAHNGLWEAAENTSESLLGRLAVAPLILEARGLDVTPGMIERLNSAGDHESARVLEIIYHDEITHVACGRSWFLSVCERLGLEPAAAFRDLQATYFAGELKPPFNHKARDQAGLPRDFYDPI